MSEFRTAKAIVQRASLPSVLLMLLSSAACDEPHEAPRVELPVVVDGSGVDDVTTDLGYRVHVTSLRLALANLQFTTNGEVHASRRGRLGALLWPAARAHPGHHAGGEVLGELTGHFFPDWLAGDHAELGVATLIAGPYEGANFTLARAEHGLEPDDPLLGHTALIEGTATRAGKTVPFSARIDSPEGRQLQGAPFAVEVRAGEEQAIGFAVLTVDPLENDTLFDGIDFLALAPDENGLRVLDERVSAPESLAAYQRLRRTLQSHDHFRFLLLP